MSPFHLEIRSAPDGLEVACHWYGSSALRPVGTLILPRAPDAATAGLPEHCVIDLAPLLAEATSRLIPDAAALAQADDLLLLRDLLDETSFTTLCEALYLFLWRSARTDVAVTVKRAPDGRAWADPDRRLVRVWFATNRRLEPSGDSVHVFSDQASAEGLHYGQCRVFIPKSHRPGATSSPWWRRWLRLQADDSLVVRATQPLPASLFWGQLARCLRSEWREGERNIFVLVHGFNVSFTEAAVRTAQIGYDLKVPGEMAFFGWPSRGGLLDYSADEATIGASVGLLAEFLDRLCSDSGAERVHLFVHSMGSRGLLGALERLAAQKRPPLQLGQVFFCAPDEDVRIFADKTRLFPQACENRTLLVSPDDKAVAVSRWKHQHDRAGLVPPFHEYPGIETIAVIGFGLLDLGHGYFAEAGPVIEDLREAIETRRQAGERQTPRREVGYFVIDLRRTGSGHYKL
jgi:esterase/lipase superfamily enzyme